MKNISNAIIITLICFWAFVVFINTFYEPTAIPVWTVVFLLVKFNDVLFGKKVVVVNVG